MSEKHLSTALVKEACPLCGKQVEGPILIDTLLRERPNQKLEDLHGKCIGYKEEPCEECQSNMSKGFMLVGVVESKCGEKVPEDVYRSGNIWVIKEESAKQMFSEEFLKSGAAFIDVNIANDMGFPECNLNA